MAEQTAWVRSTQSNVGQCSITPALSRFQRQFDAFSNGLFRGLDFKALGAFVGGGSVLASLLPVPEAVDELHDKCATSLLLVWS